MVSRLRCFIGGILFCFFTSSFALHATENDDLVKAMMEVYAEELAANPQDYRTYYSRAMAYFGQGDMKKALSDIDNANASQTINHIENPNLLATKIIVPHKLIPRESCCPPEEQR